MKNKIMTVDLFKKEVGIHITTQHNGKMSGMQSLSTSCMTNKYCKAYSKDPCKVCSKCYAQAQMKMFKNMNSCFSKNADILTNRILTMNEMPMINASLFRFEAFGDLHNETQLINYFNICKANKQTHFALWTKNSFIVESVIKQGYKKPKNLNIVLSSHYLNQLCDYERYDWVDKVFTVYTKDFAENNSIDINCGSKSCLSCKKCYIKSKNIFLINELLK